MDTAMLQPSLLPQPKKHLIQSFSARAPMQFTPCWASPQLRRRKWRGLKKTEHWEPEVVCHQEWLNITQVSAARGGWRQHNVSRQGREETPCMCKWLMPLALLNIAWKSVYNRSNLLSSLVTHMLICTLNLTVAITQNEYKKKCTYAD